MNMVVVGELLLSNAVKLFNYDVMQELKSSAGGLQTLLRKRHDVFRSKKTSHKLSTF